MVKGSVAARGCSAGVVVAGRSTETLSEVAETTASTSRMKPPMLTMWPGDVSA
jgi:hypothetical protein